MPCRGGAPRASSLTFPKEQDFLTGPKTSCLCVQFLLMERSYPSKESLLYPSPEPGLTRAMLLLPPEV